MYAKHTLLFLLVTISAATAQDAQAPVDPSATSQPGRTAIPSIDRPLGELVGRLGANDPQIRESARDQLMLLKRSDLKSLLAAAREASPLSSMQLWSLRDIAMHVFLTEVHRFEGSGAGFIGISSAPEYAASAVVNGRTIGYDGYRALRDGDTIVGMQVNRLPGRGEMKPVATFDDLRQIVSATRPGEWMTVRVIRNGQPLEVSVHLSSRDDRVGQVVAGIPSNDNPFLSQAERYWNETFLPGLKVPTTRPASSPRS